MTDPNLYVALEWANEIGPPPMLPESLKNPTNRAKLVEKINSPLVVNSNLSELSDLSKLSENEKNRRIANIGKISKEIIKDIEDLSERVNICLRLWAGCISAAKMASPETMDGPNTPENRQQAFMIIDAKSDRDHIYCAGVEAAPIFKIDICKQQILTDGIPKNSPFRKYIKS